MRRILLAVVVALAGLAVPIAARAGSPAPRFTTSGLWVLDGQGRHLYPRGFDLMGGEYTPTGNPLPYDASTFQAIRATGATVVRLPISWANVEPSPGFIDPAALARARQIVEWAGAAGLQVVLDMHQYLWTPCFGGNGMPAWAVPNCPATPPSNAAAAEVDIEIAANAFWHSAALQQDFTAAWVAVARAVGAPSYLLGYDLLNEPPPGLNPNEVFETTYLAPFYREVGTALRAVDPGGLLYVEPSVINGLVNSSSQFLAPIGLPNVVYEPHQYGATSFNADGGGGLGVLDVAGPGEFAYDLAIDKAVAQRMGAALWLGEWGAIQGSFKNVNPATYVDDDIAEQDALMVPSAYWSFDSAENAGGGLQLGPLFDRIEPAAIAGTPTTISTGTSGLTLAYTASGGTTELSVPAGCAPVIHLNAGTATAGPGSVSIDAPAGTAVTAGVSCN